MKEIPVTCSLRKVRNGVTKLFAILRVIHTHLLVNTLSSTLGTWARASLFGKLSLTEPISRACFSVIKIIDPLKILFQKNKLFNSTPSYAGSERLIITWKLAPIVNLTTEISHKMINDGLFCDQDIQQVEERQKLPKKWQHRGSDKKHQIWLCSAFCSSLLMLLIMSLLASLSLWW